MKKTILFNANIATTSELLEQIDIFIEKKGAVGKEIEAEIKSEMFKAECDGEVFIDIFFIELLKVSATLSDFKKNFCFYELYGFLSKKFNCYDDDLSFVFYELSALAKREETELGNGCRSEKQIFKNAVEIVKRYIPTFTNGIFNKRVSNKYIDLLGVCSKTGKYIIVEFKKGVKDATHQLYSYDRLLGGGNILVSLTEKDVPVKHKDIIYLTLDSEV